MGANNAVKKLHLDDDNDNVAARLLLLAEQLQSAAGELTEVVSELRKEREGEAAAKLDNDRGEM